MYAASSGCFVQRLVEGGFGVGTDRGGWRDTTRVGVAWAVDLDFRYLGARNWGSWGHVIIFIAAFEKSHLDGIKL